MRRAAAMISALTLALCTNAAAIPLPAAPANEDAEYGAIEIGEETADDEAIAARLREVYQQLPNLEGIEVDVRSGVVVLSGAAPNATAIQRAEDIARRVDGAVAVRNEIEADADISVRLQPAVDTLRQGLRSTIASLPLLGLAAAVLAFFLIIAWALGRAKRLWRKRARNPFIADLIARIAQFVTVTIGVVLALVVLDATALLTAALGAAGLIGLAVGFALRDMIENTIASVLLSLRQPFRPRDLVLINGHEGFVARLTSRATILLTLDGNHVRIPNADVFKATIINYTRNPKRRMTIELGLGVENDPIAAIRASSEILGQLDFILGDPPPGGRVINVGESNVVIEVWAWLDQRLHDFLQSRSVAIARVKHGLEARGFSLPEPIYRLRFDALGPTEAAPPRAVPKTSPAPESHSTANDPSHIRFVDQERREKGGDDLLADDAPTE
jgi:small conductance mechanosensitive channel